MWREAARWDEYQFPIPWQVATPDGIVYAEGTHRAIFWIDDAALILEPPLLESGQPVDAPAEARGVFIVNADELSEALVDLGETRRTERWLLQVIAALGRFTPRTIMAPPFDLDNTFIPDLAGSFDISRDQIAQVIDRWDVLTSFPSSLSDPSPIVVAGTISIDDDGAGTASAEHLGAYSMTANASVATLDNPSTPAVWTPRRITPDADAPNGLPAGFELTAGGRPIPSESVEGSVTAEVRDFDGAVLWSSIHLPDDPRVGIA